MKITAPWTEEQVTKLNEWQKCGWVHPFTCTCGGTLVAKQHGWECPAGCDYTQTWAHDCMLCVPQDPLSGINTRVSHDENHHVS